MKIVLTVFRNRHVQVFSYIYMYEAVHTAVGCYLSLQSIFAFGHIILIASSCPLP